MDPGPVTHRQAGSTHSESQGSEMCDHSLPLYSQEGPQETLIIGPNETLHTSWSHN